MTTSIKIGNRRLLKLASILDTADAEHRKRGEPTYEQGCFRHECGTPACALGHWIAHDDGWLDQGSSADFLKAKDVFVLGAGDSQVLFGTDGCGGARTAKQAAKYIRAFVARRSKP
jgi:hypothetical protein